MHLPFKFEGLAFRGSADHKSLRSLKALWSLNLCCRFDWIIAASKKSFFPTTSQNLETCRFLLRYFLGSNLGSIRIRASIPIVLTLFQTAPRTGLGEHKVSSVLMATLKGIAVCLASKTIEFWQLSGSQRSCADVVPTCSQPCSDCTLSLVAQAETAALLGTCFFQSPLWEWLISLRALGLATLGLIRFVFDLGTHR